MEVLRSADLPSHPGSLGLGFAAGADVAYFAGCLRRNDCHIFC